MSPAKRGSAFGSVRKRTTGNKIRWQARWQDRDGHQHSATFPTRRQADEWLSEQATDRNRGAWTDPRDGRTLFVDWQARWRSTIVDLRRSTLVRDLGYLDRYLVPAFGTAQLAEIDSLMIEAWVAELRSRLAPATVVKAGQIMSKIMGAAVRAKLIPTNPCAGVKLPRIDDHEMRFLEADEAWSLADSIDEKYRGLVLLGVGCGLRPGEMLGLRAGRVDPLRRTIDVAEIVVEADGHLYVGPPKTNAGRRRVPAPRFVMDALKPHLAGKGPDDLVFPAPRGGHVRAGNWRKRYWRPAVTAAGLEAGLRVHDLRHTAVAWWIAAGADPVDIARRAGHTSVSVVLDRYGHLLAGKADEVTDRLDMLGARPAAGGVVIPMTTR